MNQNIEWILKYQIEFRIKTLMSTPHPAGGCQFESSIDGRRVSDEDTFYCGDILDVEASDSNMNLSIVLLPS